MRLYRAGDGRCFAARVISAYTGWARLRGLLARPPLPPDTALHLRPCGAIHTVGMTRALDVIFLEADGRVCAIRRELPPLRLAWGGRRADSALEFRAGSLPPDAPRVGDRLILEGPPDRFR